MPAKQKWVVADPPDHNLVSEYAEHFGLLPVVVALAVQRIFAAVDDGETVVPYGDYDVDGVTSIALLTHILRAYGLDPDYFLRPPEWRRDTVSVSRESSAAPKSLSSAKISKTVKI